MVHVAIMKKSWGMIPKILSGEKTIESRWYKTKRVPLGKIKAGETVFFKNSGEPVAAKAKISKVIKFADLTPNKIKEILEKYGKQICLDSVPLDKKYAVLIFLNSPKKVKAFEVDKTGFGTMNAWVTIRSMGSIRVIREPKK